MEHLIIFFQQWIKKIKVFEQVLNNAKKLGYAESNPICRFKW